MKSGISVVELDVKTPVDLPEHDKLFYAHKQHFKKKEDELICTRNTFLKKSLKHSSELEENMKKKFNVGDKVNIVNDFNDTYYLVSYLPEINKNPRKIIYIRTPKTGSSSLIKSIQNSCITHTIIDDNNYKTKYDSNILIISSECYKKYVSYFTNTYPEHLKICIVRHPYSKFLSSKNYCNSSKNKTYIEVLNNLPTRLNNLHDWGHLTRTQTEGLIYNDKKQYDKLFYYEEYHKVFDFISNNFGTKIIEEHQNITKKYDNFLTSEEKKLIRKIYKKDFENFYPELLAKLHIIHRIDKTNTGDMVSNSKLFNIL